MTGWQRWLIMFLLPVLLVSGLLVSAWQIRRLEYGDQVFLSVDLMRGKVVAAGVDYYPEQIWTRNLSEAQIRYRRLALRLNLGLSLSRPPYWSTTLVQP